MRVNKDFYIVQIEEDRRKKGKIGELDIELSNTDSVWYSEKKKRKINKVFTRDKYNKLRLIEEVEQEAEDGEELYNHVGEDVAIQDGYIIACPENERLGLKPGDHVYTSHLIAFDSGNKFIHEGETYRKLHVDQIYSKVEGDDVVMLGEWVYLDPIFEKEQPNEKILKPWFHQRPLVGVVAHVNNNSLFNVGDYVLYTKHSDYMMWVEGTKYLRMTNNDIVATFEEEELDNIKEKAEVMHSRRKERKLF